MISDAASRRSVRVPEAVANGVHSHRREFAATASYSWRQGECLAIQHATQSSLMSESSLFTLVRASEGLLLGKSKQPDITVSDCPVNVNQELRFAHVVKLSLVTLLAYRSTTKRSKIDSVRSSAIFDRWAATKPLNSRKTKHPDKDIVDVLEWKHSDRDLLMCQMSASQCGDGGCGGRLTVVRIYSHAELRASISSHFGIYF
jgi:hypothetical protein